MEWYNIYNYLLGLNFVFLQTNIFKFLHTYSYVHFFLFSICPSCYQCSFHPGNLQLPTPVSLETLGSGGLYLIRVEVGPRGQLFFTHFYTSVVIEM